MPRAFSILTILILCCSSAEAEKRAPIVVGGGDFTLAVEFRFPPGYLLSDEAPSEVSVQFEDPADGHINDTTLKLGDGLGDHAVATASGTISSDEGELLITGRLYYCAAQSRLCHVHSLSERHLVVKLEGGGSVGRIPLDIRPRVGALPKAR